MWGVPGAAPKSRETAPERKAEVLRAVATERLSLRAPTGLWRGPAHDLTLARKKAEACPPLSETLLPAQPGDVLELDELWSFVGSKTNARWVWIALCRQRHDVRPILEKGGTATVHDIPAGAV